MHISPLLIIARKRAHEAAPGRTWAFVVLCGVRDEPARFVQYALIKLMQHDTTIDAYLLGSSIVSRPSRRSPTGRHHEPHATGSAGGRS